MTTAAFNYIDLASVPAGTKPWSKVDAAEAASFKLAPHTRAVTDLRGHESEFNTDNAGFAVLRSPPPPQTDFASDASVRGPYYASVEGLLRAHLPATEGRRVRRVVIFDHTIRQRAPDAARPPVQQVHVDQSSAAAAARVRRHLPEAEAAELLRGRFQIVNVWRPVAYPASDFPLAVVDWRTTSPADFVPVDLLYPRRRPRTDSGVDVDDDDRGKETRAPESTWSSTEGYEVRGETMSVAPSERHRFYYAKDMTPDEVLLLKCYDSWGEGEEPHGRAGLAVRTPHTAFVDPATPEDAPPRQSIEVRCLVFYE
ncbi:hypothetical protein F5X99DRAFT_381850 [Biscogniauxia marginata]|nr:hypothetical protein F5X99DRAFT_381850 [Biscogniauxia marginata]